MRKWLNGTDKHVPQHYSGTRPTAGRVFSRTRSLTAAAIAVAMMATVAVTSLLPAYNAKADENHNDGAICTPTSISLGTNTGSGTEDTGIATYAGGDMYVGQKVSGDMNNTSGPTGSYAAEAEGLTAVNGKLLMHPLKGLWTSYYTDGTRNGYIKDYKGFRFGIVGFGGQYRPKTGSSTLEVRGNSSDSSIDWVGGAQSWGNAGWIGQTKPTEPNYTANIAGDQTTVYGGSSNDILGKGSSNTNKYKYDDRASVYVPEGTQGTVNWQQNDNQIGSTGETFDGFGSYIKTLSGNLGNLSKQQSESIYVADAKTTTDSEYYNDLVRAKFDGTYSFKISSVHEKIIEFVGNGTSSMQVFNLPASMLNDSSSYTGVSFSFKKIPDTSSVVINVTGGNVDFHNGWRFWWTDTNNTTKELGGSYTDGDYAKRAQQIMWNFADASNVVIRGGQGSGTTTRTRVNSTAEEKDNVWAGTFKMETKDDPAAGMLGSILVPNGSFESHVSTNGRVWVGKSFAMYNPDAVGNTGGDGIFYQFINYERSHSASALDMDQERHNLPWNGSYSTSCAAIAWDKVDDTAEHKALGGTSWTVYGKKDDAVNGTNALATIADGGWNDDADAEGSFQLGNLAKNGTYFLKESGTAEGYAQNTNIYQINTGNSTTEAATTIANVFDSAGSAISTDADKLLTDGKIINKKTGSAIEWQKVDGTDNSTLLAGSTWTLSKMNGNTAEQSWNITDDQSGTEVKSITITDASGNVVASDTTITFEGNNSQTFTATAYDQQNQVITGAKLTWSSNNATVASVDQNGTVTPTGNGDATITVKSAAGKATASFTVKVSGVETSVSITGYSDGQEISLKKGETLNLTAIAKPEGNTVEWSTSSADNVSLSTIKGLEVTLTANKVTSSSVRIKAKETRTGKTVTLKVNVTAKPYLTLYFDAQNQGQWSASNVQVYYKDANNSWSAKNMSPMSGACSRYAYVNLPLTGDGAINASSEFGFRTTGGSGWYSPAAKDTTVPKALNDKGGYNFKFTNDSTLPEVVVISAGPSYSTIAPSGCAVTSTAAYSSRRVTSRSGEHRAVSAVLRAQGSVLNAVNETVSTKVDEDTAAGKFKVSDLVDGTYHLQETKAPNGYDLSNTVYTITITGGNVTWNPDVTDSKIANTRKTGSVTWTKVSSDTNNSEPLSGSEWTLKQTKTFSWVDGVAKYTDATSDATLGTVTDCVDGQNAKCSTQTSKYVDLDGAAGKLQISGLDWGEYQLIESKAPDGYDLDTTPHTFRIGPLEGDNIAGDWYANTHFNTEGTSAYNEQTTFTVNGGNIKNKPGVILPGTGGAGDYWIYAAALVAALIGVVAAGMALKVRRRQ